MSYTEKKEKKHLRADLIRFPLIFIRHVYSPGPDIRRNKVRRRGKEGKGKEKGEEKKNQLRIRIRQYM